MEIVEHAMFPNVSARFSDRHSRNFQKLSCQIPLEIKRFSSI